MRAVDDPVFLVGPRRFLDFRIQMVVPTLATLLADSPLQVFGDQGPTLGAVLADQFDHVFVLLFGPGT